MIKTPISLQELRRRIYRKAKSEKTHRFWGLFVHVTKIETLDRGLPDGEEKRRCPGHRRPDIRGHRVRGAWRRFLQSMREDLIDRQVQTQAEPPGRDPEGKRQSPNASDSLHPRPRGARCTEADPRSDLRGGLLPELLWISTEAVAAPRPGGSQAQCAAADVHRD